MALIRRISKEKYVVAGVITILIFLLGVLLGMVVDDVRISLSEKLVKEQELSYKSLQLQFLYLSTFSEEGLDNNCNVIQISLRNAIDDLGSSLTDVLEFEKSSAVRKGEYKYLFRRYLLDNLRYWLLAKQAKAKCGFETATVLYFFEDDCKPCPDQGVILTHYKKIFKDKFLVFPINVGLEEDEPIVSVLKSQYNVEKYPTIVVEGKKYEGVVGYFTLKELICNELVNAKECI